MFKRICICIISFNFFSSILIAKPNVRNRINFDDDWKFHFGNVLSPIKDFNYSIANIFSKAGKREDGHLQWKVNYEAGILSVLACKKGRKISAGVDTTGSPAEVVITPYKTTMIADGKDATVINVTVVDNEGREVPGANNLITFSITGDAKIIGAGNGDPGSHEPDKCMDGNWQRKLFNGKCQVIVQAGTSPDVIKFEAASKGLWKGSTDIITVSPENLAVSPGKKYLDKYARTSP